MTQAEPVGRNRCVRTPKGPQVHSKFLFRASELFNWRLLDEKSCIISLAILDTSYLNMHFFGTHTCLWHWVSIQKGNRVLGRCKKDFRLKFDETQQHLIHETWSVKIHSAKHMVCSVPLFDETNMHPGRAHMHTTFLKFSPCWPVNDVILTNGTLDWSTSIPTIKVEKTSKQTNNESRPMFRVPVSYNIGVTLNKRVNHSSSPLLWFYRCSSSRVSPWLCWGSMNLIGIFYCRTFMTVYGNTLILTSYLQRVQQLNWTSQFSRL